MAPKTLAPLAKSATLVADEKFSYSTPNLDLRSSLTPPLTRTPKKISAASKPRRVSDADQACRSLKSDILAMQVILDSDAPSKPTIGMRQLESDLFAIDGLPQAEDKLVALLDLAGQKASDLIDAKVHHHLLPSSDVSFVGKLLRAVVVGAEISIPRQEVGLTAADFGSLPSSAKVGDESPKAEEAAHSNPSLAVIESRAAARPPLSSESRTLLAKLGIEITSENDLDFEHLLRRLVSTARGLQTAQMQVEQRLRASSDVNSQAVQRLQLEVDALRAKIVEKDHLLEEWRQRANGSRFAPNQHRSLVTVNDAPMSFEVEQGYRHELKFAAQRIEELERAYAKLLDDGKDDRARVKQLTAELASQNSKIEELKQQISRTESEREEQRQLFLGVSRTRSEEARMSLVAVKQLESRVESLSEQLGSKRVEAENYLKSLRALYGLWVMTEEQLKAAKEQTRKLEMEFSAYKSIFNTSLADELFVVQDELIKALSLADQREATVMIQRQQLDDVDVLKNLSSHESQLWMERLKASNEWKIINVKAPEETKQLAVRLLMLTGDKEKKEAAMASSHQERLNIFKARAEREIAERLARHQQRVDIKHAASLQEELRLLTEAAAEQRRKEDEENEELRLPSKNLAMEDFLSEAAKRPTDPRLFFSQWLELRAQQQQQLLASLGR